MHPGRCIYKQTYKEVVVPAGGLIGILYAIAVILLVNWVIGLLVHVTFWALHLLLVAAVILIAWNLLTRRRAG